MKSMYLVNHPTLVANFSSDSMEAASIAAAAELSSLRLLQLKECLKDRDQKK